VLYSFNLSNYKEATTLNGLSFLFITTKSVPKRPTLKKSSRSTSLNIAQLKKKKNYYKKKKREHAETRQNATP
jgi:hypothetical protein